MNNKNKNNSKLKTRDGVLRKEKGNKKMSPYSKNEEPKWMIDHSANTVGFSNKKKKEEIRNANRSLKKGVRQQLKKELKKEIDEYSKKK